jgi:NADH dehydrogenase FAD-containing subunit
MELARKLKKAHVEVTVVDRHNHLLFQPLIYQVAAGALFSGQVAAPQRNRIFGAFEQAERAAEPAERDEWGRARDG